MYREKEKKEINYNFIIITLPSLYCYRLWLLLKNKSILWWKILIYFPNQTYECRYVPKYETLKSIVLFPSRSRPSSFLKCILFIKNFVSFHEAHINTKVIRLREKIRLHFIILMSQISLSVVKTRFFFRTEDSPLTINCICLQPPKGSFKPTTGYTCTTCYEEK